MRFGWRNHCNASSRSSGESDDNGRGFLGPGQFGLRLFHRQQQFAHVALEQVRRQAGFLGGAFHEAAALAVAAQVHLVKMEAFATTQTQA